MHTEIWWGNLKERNHLEDVGIHGRTILKWIFEGTGLEHVDWIHLARDRATVMSLHVQ
jgi:hypothetical protein